MPSWFICGRTPRKTFSLKQSPKCDSKIFTYNCFVIDFKLYLDRLINSHTFLVTFLELIKGGLKRWIFRYNLFLLNRSIRGRKWLSGFSSLGMQSIIKVLNSLVSVKMRGNETTDKKKMQWDSRLKLMLHKSSVSQPYHLNLSFSWIIWGKHSYHS